MSTSDRRTALRAQRGEPFGRWPALAASLSAQREIAIEAGGKIKEKEKEKDQKDHKDKEKEKEKEHKDRKDKEKEKEKEELKDTKDFSDKNVQDKGMRDMAPVQRDPMTASGATDEAVAALMSVSSAIRIAAAKGPRPHPIGSELRPDLSRSALTREPNLDGSPH